MKMGHDFVNVVERLGGFSVVERLGGFGAMDRFFKLLRERVVLWGLAAMAVSGCGTRLWSSHARRAEEGNTASD